MQRLRWSTCWEEVIVECPVLNETLTLPSRSRLWEHDGRRGQEECESWRVERSVMKCCLLDTTALLHLWTLSSSGYLHKIKPGNIQHGWGRYEILPLAQELLSLTAVGIREFIFLREFGCCSLSVPQWMTHNLVYVGSTDQIQRLEIK